MRHSINPENAIREAKDLILNQKVQWIQGTVSSAVALAVSAYCKEAKVPFIITVSQSAAITEEKGHRYVFRKQKYSQKRAEDIENGAFPGEGSYIFLPVKKCKKIMDYRNFLVFACE